MIEFRLNILFNSSKPVYVYRNLHKKCYSIKQNNKVIAYASDFILNDCSFIVRKSGRDLVLKTNQKNVHAFVKGFLDQDLNSIEIKTKIIYNPYKYPYFFYENDSSKSLDQVSKIFFTEDGIFSCF
jgi:hypothetical protein